ncbi:hypothetical protein [Vibrio phage BONAISHI]|nr:hypothetical protein [Vibrio phage BONAISHI]
MQEFNTLALMKAGSFNDGEELLDKENGIVYKAITLLSVSSASVKANNGLYLEPYRLGTDEHQSEKIQAIPEPTETDVLIPDHDQSKGYKKDAPVIKDGDIFRANSDITANTAFVEGINSNEWTKIGTPLLTEKERYHQVKSIVFDFFTNYGDGTYASLNQIMLFKKDGTRLVIERSKLNIVASSGMYANPNSNVAWSGYNIMETSPDLNVANSSTYAMLFKVEGMPSRVQFKFTNPLDFSVVKVVNYHWHEGSNAPDRAIREMACYVDYENANLNSPGDAPSSNSANIFTGVIPRHGTITNYPEDKELITISPPL